MVIDCAELVRRKKFHLTAKAVVLFLFLLIPTSSFSQWAFEMWHAGRIVLTEGDTLKGMVKYDLQQDLVQYTNANENAEVFTARKVLFFEIFDKTVDKYRQFYALPYNAAKSPSYKSLVFFELLESGKLSLLSREALEMRTMSTGFYGGYYSRQVLVNKYFFLDDSGNVIEFTGNKGDLLNMFGKKADTVEKYMRQNHLKLDDKYEFAQIVSYYNTL
jgi:hypothetical protein